MGKRAREIGNWPEENLTDDGLKQPGVGRRLGHDEIIYTENLIFYTYLSAGN